MIDCAYCNLPEIKERAIFRGELAWVFPTNIPIVPGHVLVCPVRHVEKFEELTSEEKNAIFALAENTKIVLRELLGAEGFHHAWNEGKIAGQSVPHFHLHLVPRKEGDAGIVDYEPRKFLYRPGSRDATPEAELKSIASEISEKLATLHIKASSHNMF